MGRQVSRLDRSSSDSVLERFSAIRSGTPCSFAAGARLRAGPDWDPSLSFAANVHRHQEQLTAFCRDATRLDGLVIELPGAFGASLPELARSVNRMIRGLCQSDQRASEILAGPIDAPGWWLVIHGVELFVLSFAPCYPEDHPRTTYGVDATYLVLQPRNSFSRRRQSGERSLPALVKRRIRRLFVDAEQPYDTDLADSPLEAHQFVKPLLIGDPPVEWWLEGTVDDDRAAR